MPEEDEDTNPRERSINAEAERLTELNVIWRTNRSCKGSRWYAVPVPQASFETDTGEGYFDEETNE